jgi:hypothetical protein
MPCSKFKNACILVEHASRTSFARMTSGVRMLAADGRLFEVDATVARMSRTLCRLLEGAFVAYLIATRTL